MSARQLAITVGVAVLMGVLGLALGRYAAYLVNAVAIAALGALSLNLIIGYCGQISFAQGALLGVGAYTAGNLSNAGLDGAVAILGGGLLGAAVSALVGLPAMRLRGLYFAIATLAAQAILEYLFKILDPLTNGVSGLVITPPTILGFPMNSDQSLVVPSLVILVLAWLAVSRLMRTDLGRAFLVVRESEIVAKGMGIDVSHAKMQAFLIGGFIAGVAGALAGYANRLASPEAFTLDLSADYIAMIIIGGLGTWPGPLIGAAFVVLLPEAIQRVGEAAGISDILSALRELAFGLLIILFLIFEPRGLTALLSRLRPRGIGAAPHGSVGAPGESGQPQEGGSR
ncbi:MAG: branched-chain amino acid ABC transporter permease [Acetobacteraceae bacterium]|nr:branched-chain amino acid ABC transporter permease [Acetobacteraceae bacterium]